MYDWKKGLSSWPLEDEMNQPYFKELIDFLEREYDEYTIFPPFSDVFHAYEAVPLSEVKVVILGQDPYHEKGQAHGLAFSVKPHIDIPPSLCNIYKELQSDLGLVVPNNGYLEKWASQGVFMLNTVLTVREGEANSHKGKGWERFTDATVRLLNEQDRPIVYLLWGKPAQTKLRMLNNPKQLKLCAPHPSPLSVYRGFWGCRHFSMCNDFLKANHLEPIDWQIEDI